MVCLAQLCAGYWDRIDLLYVFAQRSTAGAKINWVNPGTFTATDDHSTTFIKYQGFDGNGSSTHLESNYIPSVNANHISQNSTAVGSWVISDMDVADITIGGKDVTGGYRIGLFPKSDGNMRGLINSNDAAVSVNASSVGLSMSARTAADLITNYMNGVSLGTGTDASIGLPTVELYLLAENADGTAASYFDGIISIEILMDGVVDQTEATKIYNIFHRYMTRIGQ